MRQSVTCPLTELPDDLRPYCDLSVDTDWHHTLHRAIETDWGVKAVVVHNTAKSDVKFVNTFSIAMPIYYRFSGLGARQADFCNDRRESGGGCFLRRGDRVLGLLHPFAELLGLGHERRLLLFRSLGDALAVRVLCGAELFERGDGGTARSIGVEGDVDGVGRLAARLLRALDQLGILAKKHGIDHPASLVGAHDRAPGLSSPPAGCPRPGLCGLIWSS